ncbi:unnamed protein product, partial [Effrenium voratum]
AKAEDADASKPAKEAEAAQEKERREREREEQAKKDLEIAKQQAEAMELERKRKREAAQGLIAAMLDEDTASPPEEQVKKAPLQELRKEQETAAIKPDPSRCQARTWKGGQCSLRPCSEHRLCHSHERQLCSARPRRSLRGEFY